MIRSLILKELRETWGIAAAALALYLAEVGGLIGFRVFKLLGTPSANTGLPFIADSFLWYYVVVSACFAAALGLWQTLREQFFGTYLFLLHRPMSVRGIIATKVLFGLTMSLACAAIPILLYAAWAATPGSHPGPFVWSMTLPAWKVWLSIPAIYLAAFLAGFRPARWLGTRLLPCAVVAIVVMLMSVPLQSLWVAVAFGSLTLTALVASLYEVVAARDYA